MAKSSIMIDLNDPRSAKIADAISNKTSKKILALLSEKDMKVSEISDKLKIPLNTASYNIKILIEAGLVERSKTFFWSSKGKRMEIYRISNKRIIISPKSMARGVIPTLIITGIFAFGIKLWTDARINSSFSGDGGSAIESAQAAGDIAIKAGESLTSTLAESQGRGFTESILQLAQSSWLWFLSGALVALLAYLLYSYFRQRNVD